MKIKLFVCIICLIFGSLAYGQSDNKGSFKDKIFVGGNLGASFGTITNVEVSPLIGYRITDRLASGIGVSYIYYKDTRYDPDYSTNIYAGRVFSQYDVIENILAYTEFEILNIEYPTTDNSEERKNIYAWLVGGAYKQPIGRRSSLNMYILWDLIEDQFTPYQNPIIRIGINAGL